MKTIVNRRKGKFHKRSWREAIPPVIEARMQDFFRGFKMINPNITIDDYDDIVSFLLSEKGLFYGLYNNDGTINRAWLDLYLQDNDNLPDILKIPFTPAMQADIAHISAMPGISEKDKQALIDSLFAKGGKYDGYIQLDGTVDESRIIGQNSTVSEEPAPCPYKLNPLLRIAHDLSLRAMTDLWARKQTERFYFAGHSIKMP